MAARFDDLERRGDQRLYAREAARFVLHVLHDPQRALQLGQADWAFQRAPEDARVFLEAALAAGHPEAATRVLDFVATTGLEDPAVRAMARSATAQIATPAGRRH